MACLLKRPCNLNFASMLGLELECPLSTMSRGSATPGRSRICEKRPSPDTSYESKERSPKAVRPALDTFLPRQSKSESEQDGAAPKRMRRSSRRCVSFSGCSKNHDGLRLPSRLLDELVFAYFENQHISRPEDIQRLILTRFGRCQKFFCPAVLEDVLRQLHALCARCASLKKHASMPVLLRGGGRGLQLQSIHAPHLRRLTHFFQVFKTAVLTAQ